MDLVGLGGLGVVLVVEEAGDVGVVALLARHPQVARAAEGSSLVPFMISN